MSIRKRSDRDHAAHLQGTLDLLILRTLIFGPEHGQGIARAIQRESEDVLIVDHGSLYPALQRLEERGFIDAEWGTSERNRKARFYTLTPKGRKELVREESEWRRIAAAIMTDATRVAILNANYIKARLQGHYDVLYANHNGRVAHEMIFDLRPYKHAVAPV